MIKLNRKQLILISSLFVITFAVTALARVPTGITYQVGKSRVNAGVYATAGDAMVYVSVLILGFPWGAAVSAVGAALADLVVGSKLYIIGSLLIKPAMALCAAGLANNCNSWKRCFAVAGITELVMLVGYFLYDLVIVREFAVAGQAFLINLIQAVVCTGLGGLALHFIPVVHPERMPAIKLPEQRSRANRDEDPWN